MTHVPYKGAAAAVADLLGGQIDLTFAAISTTIPHIKAGKLRALGVSTDRRSPLLPDTPTITESGVAGYDVSYWTGVTGPRGMPQPIADRLQMEIVRVLRKPEIGARFTTLGAEIIGSSKPEAEKFVDTEITKWTALVKKIGLKGE
jgi:tripartite-type tricarboxylate transporter receptor subunit TctC